MDLDALIRNDSLPRITQRLNIMDLRMVLRPDRFEVRVGAVREPPAPGSLLDVRRYSHRDVVFLRLFVAPEAR